MSKVELIAWTETDWNAMRAIGFEAEPYIGEADRLAEFAGRNCYRSFDKPNPKTARTEDYLANILRQQHYSVLEHASATFYIEASRSVLAEITRHRHLSFSVVSQRYVDPTRLGQEHLPPLIRELPMDVQEEAEAILSLHMDNATDAYYQLYAVFDKAGYKRKQIREAARAVLPNMTDSPMVVTGNHRAWREVLAKRLSPAADREIQEVANKLLDKLVDLAPATYQDLIKED